MVIRVIQQGSSYVRMATFMAIYSHFSLSTGVRFLKMPTDTETAVTESLILLGKFGEVPMDLQCQFLNVCHLP